MCTCDTQSTLTVQAAANGPTFKVADMTCAHCAGTIRSAPQEGMPGVEVSIDLDAQQVVVAGGAAAAEAIIREAGYGPLLLVH